VSTLDENWEKVDIKVASTIQSCLADEVTYNVMDEETVTGLWSRLKTYMTKRLSSRLYLKTIVWATHDRRDKVLKHLNFFNKVISEFLVVDVKIDEEDKTLILFSSFHSHTITSSPLCSSVRKLSS